MRCLLTGKNALERTIAPLLVHIAVATIAWIGTEYYDKDAYNK